MSEFDNAFNNASIGLGINKVNVTGKQEESINPQENKKNYGENSTETILQTSVTNAPAEQVNVGARRKMQELSMQTPLLLLVTFLVSATQS